MFENTKNIEPQDRCRCVDLISRSNSSSNNQKHMKRRETAGLHFMYFYVILFYDKQTSTKQCKKKTMGNKKKYPCCSSLPPQVLVLGFFRERSQRALLEGIRDSKTSKQYLVTLALLLDPPSGVLFEGFQILKKHH